MRTFRAIRFSVLSQLAVKLCTNVLPASVELDGRQLVFIVFLKSWRDRAEEFGLIDGQLLDICGCSACGVASGEVIWYLR